MTVPALVEGPARLSCEALVIGSGAGGASVASALAAAGVDVLVLEEGPYVPADAAPATLAQSMLTMWRGGGLVSTLGKAQIAYAEGCCVGGSTEINSAILQRAPEEVIEDWAKANRLRDLTPDSLDPYYDRAAAAVNASPTAGDPGPPTHILERAGRAMGWSVAKLERAQRACVGTNHCSAGCPTGGKQSMSATLIPRALASGARLVARCKVGRLQKRGRRVTGAEAAALDAHGRRHKVTVAASSVFLCAGTIETPALLQRSGITQNIGRSFQLHPTIRVLARFPERVDAHRQRLPLAAITEFMPALRFGGSVFTLPTYGMMLAEDWARRSAWLDDYAHHAIYYAMIRPDGVGRIRTLPGLAAPVVSYELTERDWRRLGEGARLLARALLEAGAERVVPSIRGHAGWTSAAELARDASPPAPATAAAMTIHLFASCPMGEDRAAHPVDSYGRLAGLDNLVLADGSVLPGAPGVNPQGTIMALAFRAADGFLANRN